MPNYNRHRQIMKDYCVAKVTIIVTNICAMTQSSATLREQKLPLLKSTEGQVANLVSDEKEISSLRQFKIYEAV